MNLYSTEFVILAGGCGTRLKVDLPKPVVKLGGKPMLLHILEMIHMLNPSEEIIISSSLRNMRAIKRMVNIPVKAVFCRQMKPSGTADAVRNVLRKIEIEEKNVLVILADRPLTKAGTIEKLIKKHIQTNSMITMLTSKVPNYDGFYRQVYYDGRIIRDSKGNIVGNLETNELSDREMNENMEVYPSTYIYNKDWLKENIEKIKKNPEKGEYYLTQMVNIARSQGEKVNSLTIDASETLGVNTQEQLTAAEEVLRARARSGEEQL
ncbi:MAG: sugar phosphate nucleotidyltransferase [Patescibacteria group bacterium]|nr:NTP transferase domain-containing protein [Patescibacteria group bacterium]